VGATEPDGRDLGADRVSDGLSPATLELAGEHVGEGERSGRLVILAEQIQPLDGHEDALGHHVTERRVEQAAPVGTRGRGAGAAPLVCIGIVMLPSSCSSAASTSSFHVIAERSSIRSRG